MTSKFEQLIEYVINDEEAKAKELFHEIVVEKSREIYENLMTEEDEELEEAEELEEESTHDEDEKAEKAGKKVTKDIEYDDKKDRMDEAEDEEMEESMDETMGGDAADDLIDDVEAEEEGMEMAEEEGEEDHHADMGGNEELEDRVVDLEDKLDELMAEFEALMGDEGGEEEIEVDMDAGEGGDALEMDDTEEFKDEPMPMEEAVNLSAAPKPVTAEEGSVNKKSVNADNSGAVGAAANPVKMTGDTAQGRPAPTTKELIGKVQNSVGGKKTMSPAPKPVTSQATGVNTKTPFPKA
jgi:hypothetical protein